MKFLCLFKHSSYSQMLNRNTLQSKQKEEQKLTLLPVSAVNCQKSLYINA